MAAGFKNALHSFISKIDKGSVTLHLTGGKAHMLHTVFPCSWEGDAIINGFFVGSLMKNGKSEDPSYLNKQIQPYKMVLPIL